MSPTSPVRDEHVIALRFLIAVGSATVRQIGAAVASQLSPLRNFGLAGHYGYLNEAPDLVALGLASQNLDTFTPTDAGRRLLESIDNAHNTAALQPGADEPTVIVGVPRERLFYSEILGEIVGKDDVLFVDPYLAAADLRVLSRLSAVTRVLTGSRPVADRGERDPERRVEALAIVAGSRENLEVRLTAAIHDRFVLPARAPGLTLGASLAGSKITTAIELSPERSALIRDQHEEIWTQATPIDPIAPPTE